MDAVAVVTLIERLTESVKLTDAAARTHLAGCYVRVDGEVVTEPDAEIDRTARLTIQPPPGS